MTNIFESIFQEEEKEEEKVVEEVEEAEDYDIPQMIYDI